MRQITGYLLTLLLIPVFIFTVTHAYDEAGRAESFHHILDRKIDLHQTNLSETSLITDSDGKIVEEIHLPMNRSEVSPDEIPEFLKRIFVVSEDRNFYQHPGFDLTAIARAMAINIHSDDIEQGASTITQQLARNQYLNHDRSYNRKLSEILYAYQLERSYTKEELLAKYLNAIYFQNNAYGIAAAADFYFQKKPLQLTEAEQAFLAAIPNNPNLYNPLKHYDRTKERQERLVDELALEGKLPAKKAEGIKDEAIILRVKERTEGYPDYSDYVMKEFRELVQTREKLTDAEAGKRVEELLKSGITIHTGLDIQVQERTKKAISSYLPYSGIEGAAVVADHETGRIVALAGGKNYRKGDFNRAFQAFRQPGSSIKPLLVYAPYFERSKAGILSKINAGPICIKGYCPGNYGGSAYGSVTVENAFIHSYNTAAVRLLHQVGVETAFKDLSPFGFQEVTANDHVLASAVGGLTTGMSPLEMTSAYTVFSNHGTLIKPRAIVKVTDNDGNLLYKWNEKPVTVWNPVTASKVRELMEKTVSSGTAKAAMPGNRAGGKTGTTNDYKDFWFIGFNRSLTAGVWVGKDTPQSMEVINSTSPHLLIWREIVK
ncbi:transglycosylase domain-containing protein [Bacillus sp. REN3]|uniref:transglycosylase domain-containing protein n=1 Tax=Bacillus sp. REN3 TaxID=2802440 RepID=UPI001AEDA1F7|nr:transglycosylase domain-containing protein [Bacillus sp. REN3]